MCQIMSLHGVISYFILPFQFVRLFWSRSVVQLMPGMMAESYFMDKCSSVHSCVVYVGLLKWLKLG